MTTSKKNWTMKNLFKTSIFFTCCWTLHTDNQPQKHMSSWKMFCFVKSCRSENYYFIVLKINIFCVVWKRRKLLNNNKKLFFKKRGNGIFRTNSHSSVSVKLSDFFLNCVGRRKLFALRLIFGFEFNFLHIFFC